jgi:hypothetical protein
MSRQVWKFKLALMAALQPIQMPRGAEILSVQTQRDMPCIWALVDNDAARETRVFRIVGTGHSFDDHGMHYLGTVQTPPFVWHVFESKP